MRRNDAASAMLRNGTFRPATANSPLRFSKRKLVVPLDSTSENENLNTTNTQTDTPKDHRTPSDKSMDGPVGNELLEFRKRHMAASPAASSSSPLKSRKAKEQKQLTPTPTSKRREKKELQVDRFAAVRSKNSRNGGGNGGGRSTGRSPTRPSATSSSTRGSADRGGGRNLTRPSSTQRSDPFANIAKESPRHLHRSTDHTLRTTTPQRRKDSSTNPTHPKASSSHTKSKAKSSTTPSSNSTTTTTTTAQIEFESLLRIRPFTTTETQSNDRNVLTTPASSSASSTTLTHPNTILLHPLTKPTASRQKELYEDAVTKFHFDSIVGSDVQEKELYEEHVGGLDMAWDVMSPLMETNHEIDGSRDGSVGKGSKKVEGGSRSVVKNHVILSMGVSNSGKTYSLFGSRYNRASSRHRAGSTSARSQEATGVKEENQEGIVLRLVEDLFVADNGRSMDQLLAQSHSSSWDSEEDCPKQGSGARRESNTTSFGVELSMVHVHNEHIFDMLSPFADMNKIEASGSRSSMGRKQSNVMKMAASFESIKKNYKASLGSIQQQQQQQQQHHGNTTKEETLPPMQELKISQDRRTSDFLIHPTIVTCSNPKEVMNYMDKGMEYSTTSSTKMNENSSRGHTMITLRPILTMQPGTRSHTSKSATRLGGSITIIDMAGIERTKTSAVRGKSMRESISINGSSTAVLQCLRAIKNNQSKAAKNTGMNNTEVENADSATLEANASSYSSQKAQLVPYRQCKLTMLMQPLFSGSLGGSKGRKEGYNALTSVKTNVLLLVSAYPGIRDYNEKKSLLQEIDSLRGLTVTKSIAHQQRQRRRSSAAIIDPTKDIPSSESIVRDLRQQKMIKSDPATVEEETRSHRHDEHEIFSSPSPLVPSPSHPIPTSTVSSPIDSPELEPLHRQRAGSINDDHSHAISTMRSPLRQQSPLKRLSNMVNPLSCKKRKAKEEEDVLTKRIRVLEKEHESLMEKHNAMETKCTILQEENMSLMVLLEESKERERELSIQLKQQQEENEQNDKKRGTKRKSNDDTFFQAVRDVRRKEQTLLPSPLRRHMEEVEQNELLVYGGISGPTTGRCFKEPFPLVVPCTQQPRPSLQQPFQATALQFLSQLDGRASSQDNEHIKGSSNDTNHKQGFDGMALQFLSNLDKPREKNDKSCESDASA